MVSSSSSTSERVRFLRDTGESVKYTREQMEQLGLVYDPVSKSYKDSGANININDLREETPSREALEERVRKQEADLVRGGIAYPQNFRFVKTGDFYKNSINRLPKDGA
mgnify:FL=1